MKGDDSLPCILTMTVTWFDFTLDFKIKLISSVFKKTKNLGAEGKTPIQATLRNGDGNGWRWRSPDADEAAIASADDVG